MNKLGELVSPARAMRLAIEEGKKGAGFVSPNPLVGCAIVSPEGRLLSLGYHARLGQAHAEVDALNKLSDPGSIKGAHVFVTLEPCAHQGRTPSCARTLAPLKPASVTYAVADPNPIAQRGAEILREAGVVVHILSEREDIDPEERMELTARAEELAEVFLQNHRHGRPFVSVKVATSLDGKMAFVTGESKWITGAAAREHSHLIRAQHDAVGVGRNTFVADDPALNVRHPRYPEFKNKVVLFDPNGKLASAVASSQMAKVRSPRDIVLVTSENANVCETELTILRVPMVEESFDINQLLNGLRGIGINSLMIEGGAHTIGSFINHGCVQRLHLYLAPVLLGGKHGLPWSAHFGGTSMAEKILLQRTERQTLGEDLYWTARLN